MLEEFIVAETFFFESCDILGVNQMIWQVIQFAMIISVPIHQWLRHHVTFLFVFFAILVFVRFLLSCNTVLVNECDAIFLNVYFTKDFVKITCILKIYGGYWLSWATFAAHTIFWSGTKNHKQTNKTHHLIMNSEHYGYSKDIKKFNGFKERGYVPSAHFPSKNSASWLCRNLTLSAGQYLAWAASANCLWYQLVTVTLSAPRSTENKTSYKQWTWYTQYFYCWV